MWSLGRGGDLYLDDLPNRCKRDGGEVAPAGEDSGEQDVVRLWHQDDGEQDVVWHQGGGEQDLWDDALHQDCWDQDEFQVEKQMVRSLRDTIEKAVAVITLLYVTSSLYQLWPRKF